MKNISRKIKKKFKNAEFCKQNVKNFFLKNKTRKYFEKHFVGKKPKMITKNLNRNLENNKIENVIQKIKKKMLKCRTLLKRNFLKKSQKL